MHSFTSLLLPVHRGIRLHGISSRRGSPQYCSPQAPLGINDASSSINSCKFLSTAATTRLWQHCGFCPVCAIRGRDLQQKQRHQFLGDILLVCTSLNSINHISGIPRLQHSHGVLHLPWSSERRANVSWASQKLLLCFPSCGMLFLGYNDTCLCAHL